MERKPLDSKAMTERVTDAGLIDASAIVWFEEMVTLLDDGTYDARIVLHIPKARQIIRELAALRASVAEKDARIAELELKYNAAVVQEKEHCKDCCCARSWKALGITQYTGKSIPEHIDALRTQLADAVGTLHRLHNATLVLLYNDSISNLKVAYHDAADCLKRLGVTGGKHE